jgi:transketolase
MLVVHDAYGLYEAVTSVPGLNATLLRADRFILCCYGTVNDIRKSLGLDGIQYAKSSSLFKDKKT